MKNLYSLPLTLAITAILFSCNKIDQPRSISISDDWKFKSEDETNWREAEVPGTIHTDLLSNGEIDDPFYRLNEHNLQWIDKKNWEYRTEFDIDKKDFEADNLELEFRGLDTYSKVYLNDKLVLETDNMFRTYSIDIKPFAKRSGNKLRLLFDSPINRGLSKYDSLPYTIPVSDNDLAEIGKVVDNKQVSIFTRKAGYHFGWDWGPRLVSSGIWRPIIMRSWSSHRIENLFVQQESLSDDVATLNAQIEIDANTTVTDAIVEVFVDGVLAKSKDIIIDSDLEVVSIPFEINNPKRWWPNGMGDQHLYEVTAKISSSSATASESQKIGLRTIEIVQEEDSIGTSFFFKVNGIPTFMKGANYIPQDVFLSRVDSQDYDRIIDDAKDANMNMLRVWGGGIYEEDIFYEKCDEAGILVWQDFMFACAMFPGDDDFLENVRQEAIDNVKRIRHHTSIALWCGNNEVLSAWENWGWKRKVIEEQSQEVADEIWKAYDDIFHSILPEVVQEYDGKRFYWPSSPGSEFGKTENFTQGDAHYWMVWWGKRPFDEYNKAIPRFMSEFGFQSFPNMPTINRYTTSEDHDVYSEVMKSHQRSSIGNVTIEEYMKRHYRDPKDFESFIYTSQVLQAQGIQTGIEAHRRSMDRCMGSLYWQINDCWPVASWSSIDYYGNWKALHYQVKRSFEKVILSFEKAEEGIHIHVVSDSLENFEAELAVTAIDLRGEELKDWKKSITVKSNGSDIYQTISTSDLTFDESSSLLIGELRVGNKTIASGILNTIPFKDIELIDPGIQQTVQVDGKDLIIELKTKNFAKSIYLSDGSVDNFSDNYFDMLPNTSKIIRLSKKDEKEARDSSKKVKVISLFDSYSAKGNS